MWEFKNLIPSFVHYFLPSFRPSFIHSFFHSFIPSFLHSLIHSFLHSFIRSFIHSFIHSVPLSFLRSWTTKRNIPWRSEWRENRRLHRNSDGGITRRQSDPLWMNESWNRNFLVSMFTTEQKGQVEDSFSTKPEPSERLAFFLFFDAYIQVLNGHILNSIRPLRSMFDDWTHENTYP
jgi:hypothetical protein